MQNILSPRISITIGGKETYLQYNTYLSTWYLEHFGVTCGDMFSENQDLGQVLHLLRAGLIQANFAENKEIIDRGDIENVRPTLSELSEMISPETIIELSEKIIDGLVKSLPETAIGEALPSKKKLSIGLPLKSFGAIFCTIRRKVFCKRLSKRLSKALTNSPN